MSVEEHHIYPDCQTTMRTVEIGGLTKSELLKKLNHHSILMNKLGEKLFDHDAFTTSEKVYSVKTVELHVRSLGFPEGATIPQVYQQAHQVGLTLCPLELGPHLRLKYLDQPEGYLGKPSYQNRSPYGSVHIASEILSENVDVPKGFYLRRIDGVLWLRGYIADDLHVLDPGDRLIFCQNGTLESKDIFKQ